MPNAMLKDMTNRELNDSRRTGPEPKCATCGHGTLSHNAVGGACTKCDCGHFKPAKNETRCLRPGCHGILRSEASIKRGMSRDCDRKVRHALAAEAESGRFTPEQAEKADAAIRSGHVRELAPGLYGARSSRDAGQWYATDGNSCTCPAGSRSHPLRCWQLLAARVFAALARPARNQMMKVA